MRNIFHKILIVSVFFMFSPTASFAATDMFGNELPFNISIPESWVELSPSDIHDSNKLAPQTKIIQGYHPRGLSYPRLVIFDNNTPISKIKNSIEAEELVRIVNSNNFGKDLNNEIRVNHSQLKIDGPIAFYDKDKNLVVIRQKNNYGGTTLLSEIVVFVREHNPLVLGFYSLENEYQKDSIVFEGIKNSVTFSEANVSDDNDSKIGSGFYLTKDDVVSFMSWAILVGIFLIIQSLRKKKVNKKTTHE